MRRLNLQSEETRLIQVVMALSAFLMPPTSAAVRGEPFEKDWPPNGLWQ